MREPSSARRARPPPPGGTGLRRSQTAPPSGRLRPQSAALCLRVLHRVPWRPGRPGEPGSQPGLDLAVGRWGPGWPGGQRSGFRVWARSLGPCHPVPASAWLQKNPLTLVFLIPPRLGTHAGGGGVAPHPARDTESWTLFSDSDPASPGPSGGDPAGLPECQHPALPLAEKRQGGPEQGAGRSELQLARSKRDKIYRNGYKSKPLSL